MYLNIGLMKSTKQTMYRYMYTFFVQTHYDIQLIDTELL